MAAAFQNAARTLAGRALQRTQAAKVDVGLLPRHTPSGSPATASSSRLLGSSSSGVPNRYKNMDDDQARVLMELDQKKEEMYDLLTKVTGNQKYRHPFWVTRNQNWRLQEQLSVHIDVRPDCRQWRWDRRGHLFSKCIRYAGAWIAVYAVGKDQRDVPDGEAPRAGTQVS